MAHGTRPLLLLALPTPSLPSLPLAPAPTQEARAHHASATTSEVDPPCKMSGGHHAHRGEGSPHGLSKENLRRDQAQQEKQEKQQQS